MHSFRQYGALQSAGQAASRRSGALVGHRAFSPHVPVTARSRAWRPEHAARSFLSAARPLILYPTSRGQTPPIPAPRRSLAPRHPTTVPVRHCSHRRNMCRHSGPDDSSAAMDITQAREVLPTNVKPVHYNLTLEPDFETFTYEGSVTIE